MSAPHTRTQPERKHVSYVEPPAWKLAVAMAALLGAVMIVAVDVI